MSAPRKPPERGQLHRGIIHFELPVGLRIESCVMADRSGFFLTGWLYDGLEQVEGLVLKGPDGQEAPVAWREWRQDRADVAEQYAPRFGRRERTDLGFRAFVDLGEPVTDLEGLEVELRVPGGPPYRAQVPPPDPDPLPARQALISLVEGSDKFDPTPLERHLHAALERLTRRCVEAGGITRTNDLGELPPAPEVSVVVPLYRSLHLLDHQVFHFSRDPDFLARAELILVLDSPELAGQLEIRAFQLYQLYGVPMRLVFLERNVGYAQANNLGATQARAPRLLLLNSDAFPARPGWLGELLVFADAHPEAGVIGPKLLFEDDSIQHAGLFFTRNMIPNGTWQNLSRYKGYARAFPAACEAGPVPAVTGACMLVGRQDYEELGGLDPSYVRGDCEDTDLCLRFLEKGRTNWYAAGIELYHLEAQSYPSQTRIAASTYNHWLQTRRWDALITEVSARYPWPPAG